MRRTKKTMNFINSLKSIYNGFSSLKAILTNMYILNSITLEQLEDEAYMKTLKINILNSGCIGIKFCQWYISHTSSNYDTKSIKMCDFFNDIFEQCPYHSLDHTRKILEADLSSSLENMFDMSFFKPIASGSIGQIYYTRMKSDNNMNGNENKEDTYIEVAVKVKHPNIDETIADYVPYLKLFKLLQKNTYLRRRFKIYFDIQDFIDNINLQTNFENEVVHANIFRENFKDNKFIVIPEILAYSKNIIISRYESGLEINDLSPYQKYKTIINLTCFIYQCIVIDDFIHGDFHIKNWRVRQIPGSIADFQLIIYDCGICIKTGNLELNRNFWNTFTNGNTLGFINIIKTMFIGNLTDENYKKIDELITQIYDYLKYNKLNISYIIGMLTDFLSKHNDIMLNKILLDMLILTTLYENLFRKQHLLTYDSSVEEESIDIDDVIKCQHTEIINFCKVNSNGKTNIYPKLLEYIEFLYSQNKSKQETKKLFSSIRNNIIKFKPIMDGDNMTDID